MSKKTTLPGLLTISVDALIRALQLLLRQAIGTASTGGWQAVEPIMGLNLGDDVAPDEYYHHYAVVNVEHTDRVLEGFHFVFIDLEKFTPKTLSLADISKATSLTTDEIADLYKFTYNVSRLTL